MRYPLHRLTVAVLLLPLLPLAATAQETNHLTLSASAGVVAPRLHPIGEVSLTGSNTLLTPRLSLDYNLSYKDGTQTDDEMRVTWTGGLHNRYIGNYQLRHTKSRRMGLFAGGTLHWIVSDRDRIGLSSNIKLQNTWDQRYHIGVNNIVPFEAEGHTTYSGELERLSRAGGALPDRYPGWNGARLKKKWTGGLTLSGDHRLSSSSAP